MLTSVSIANKNTGSFYINGKARFLTNVDLICSFMIIGVIIGAITYGYYGLGQIIDVKLSQISDYQFFFGEKASAIQEYLSDVNTTRVSEMPEFYNKTNF